MSLNTYTFKHYIETIYNLKDLVKFVKYNPSNNSITFTVNYKNYDIVYCMNDSELSLKFDNIININDDNHVLIKYNTTIPEITSLFASNKLNINHTNKFDINDAGILVFDEFNNNNKNNNEYKWNIVYKGSNVIIKQLDKNPDKNLKDKKVNNIYLLEYKTEPKLIINDPIPKDDITIPYSHILTENIMCLFYKNYFEYINKNNNENIKINYDIYSIFDKPKINIMSIKKNNINITSDVGNSYDYNISESKIYYKDNNLQVDTKGLTYKNSQKILFDDIYFKYDYNLIKSSDKSTDIKFNIDNNYYINIKNNQNKNTSNIYYNLTDNDHNLNDIQFNKNFLRYESNQFDYNPKITTQSNDLIYIFDKNNKKQIVTNILINNIDQTVEYSINIDNFKEFYGLKTNNTYTFNYANPSKSTPLIKKYKYKNYELLSDIDSYNISFTFKDTTENIDIQLETNNNIPLEKTGKIDDYKDNYNVKNVLKFLNDKYTLTPNPVCSINNMVNCIINKEIKNKTVTIIDENKLQKSITINGIIKSTFNMNIINYNPDPNSDTKYKIMVCPEIIKCEINGYDTNGMEINGEINGIFLQDTINIASQTNEIISGEYKFNDSKCYYILYDPILTLKNNIVYSAKSIKEKLKENSSMIILNINNTLVTDHIINHQYFIDLMDKTKNTFSNIEFKSSDNTLILNRNNANYIDAYKIDLFGERVYLISSNLNDFNKIIEYCNSKFLLLDRLTNITIFKSISFKKASTTDNTNNIINLYYGDFNEHCYQLKQTNTDYINKKFSVISNYDFNKINSNDSNYFKSDDIIFLKTGFKISSNSDVITYYNPVLNIFNSNKNNFILDDIIINNANKTLTIIYKSSDIEIIRLIIDTASSNINIIRDLSVKDNPTYYNDLVFVNNQIKLIDKDNIYNINNDVLFQIDPNILKSMISNLIDTIELNIDLKKILVKMNDCEYEFNGKENGFKIDFPLNLINFKINLDKISTYLLVEKNQSNYDFFNKNECRIFNYNNEDEYKTLNYNVMDSFIMTNQVFSSIEYDIINNITSYKDFNNNIINIYLDGYIYYPKSIIGISEITYTDISIGIKDNQLFTVNKTKTKYYLNYSINEQQNFNLSSRHNFKSIANANFFGNILTIINYLTYVYINLNNKAYTDPNNYKYINIDDNFFINFICNIDTSKTNIENRIDIVKYINIDNYSYSNHLYFSILDINKPDFNNKTYYLQIETKANIDCLHKIYYRCISKSITNINTVKFIINFIQYMMLISRYITYNNNSYASLLESPLFDNNKKYCQKQQYPLIEEKTDDKQKPNISFNIPLPDNKPMPTLNFTFDNANYYNQFKITLKLDLINCQNYNVKTNYSFKSDKKTYTNLDFFTYDEDTTSVDKLVTDYDNLNIEKPIKIKYYTENYYYIFENENYKLSYDKLTHNLNTLNIIIPKNLDKSIQKSTIDTHDMTFTMSYTISINHTLPSTNIIKTTKIEILLSIKIKYENESFNCSYNYDIINNSFYGEQYISYNTKKSNSVNILIPATFSFFLNEYEYIEKFNQNIFYNNNYYDYIYEFYFKLANKMIITFNYFPEQEMIDNYLLILIEFITFVLSFMSDICIDTQFVKSNLITFKYDLFKDKINAVNNNNIYNYALNDTSITHFAWSCNMNNEICNFLLTKPLSINFFKNTITHLFSNTNTFYNKNSLNDIVHNGSLKFIYEGKNIKINSIYGNKDKSILNLLGLHSYLTNMLDPLHKYPNYDNYSLYSNITIKSDYIPYNLLTMFDIARKIDP